MCGPQFMGSAQQASAHVGNVDPVNLTAADAEMRLSPEERALYQRHLTNLWTDQGVDNPDGSRSTLYAMSADTGGRTYMLPTVYDGQILTPRQAFERAMASGISEFPSYPDHVAADARYRRMHDFMERDVRPGKGGR